MYSFIRQYTCITQTNTFIYCWPCHASSGDQEDADSITAGAGNILSWRLIMNFFYGNSLPSADSRRAIVNTWRKNMYCIWLTEDYSRNISIKIYQNICNGLAWFSHIYEFSFTLSHSRISLEYSSLFIVQII